MRVILLISLFFILDLSAKCYFVSCVPEGISGETQVNGHISDIDKEIKKKIEKIQKQLDEEKKLLEEINALNDEYIMQTKKKQLLLNRIIHENFNSVQVLEAQK